ncbi:MAG TPA: hypothetical protein PK788_04395 [Gemmatimonadaceae bacterium]|nr:hypothetical protein [Gemmatimonadaceae bacterium]
MALTASGLLCVKPACSTTSTTSAPCAPSEFDHFQAALNIALGVGDRTGSGHGLEAGAAQLTAARLGECEDIRH